MSKRILAMILALIMVFSMAACGTAEKTLDYLVLVNKENKLPDDWEKTVEIVTVKNSFGDEVEVDKAAADAYQKLKDALEKDDVKIDLDSSRRTVEEQQKIWDDFMEKYGEVYTKRTVAVPGYSEHHTGLALDLYLNIDGEDVYYNEDMVQYPEVWAKIHARLAEFGFILRYLEGKEAITGYGYEPWHIRYVGSDKIAKEITDKGITLEEYLDRLPKGDVAPPKEEPEPAEEGFVFKEWNEGAPALEALKEYVEAVTDEKSPDFIPVEDRIAVFDMDGTLCAELCPTYLEYYMLAWRILKDPSYEPDEETLQVGRDLRDGALDKSFSSDMPMRHALAAAKAYSGMTLTEFSAFVTGILVRDVDGFTGMTYAESFYLPMLEVIEYLQDNDFDVFVVSGSDRFICRTFLEGIIDIPYKNIIGMDVQYRTTQQGDADGLDYTYTADDEVIRGDELLIKNLKTNKVFQIVRDIGKQPVLSFGNSSGDTAMHMYTITGNPYRSAAFMLVADDEERDYGNTESGKALAEKWSGYGFNVISMKDDFRTIYGDNVKKTGSFHWLEELAED